MKYQINQCRTKRKILKKDWRLFYGKYLIGDNSFIILNLKYAIIDQILSKFKLAAWDMKLKKLFRQNGLLFPLLIAYLISANNNTIVAQSVTGGVFIPRNEGYEGRIGLSHVIFNNNSGGVMKVIVGEWPNFKTIAKLDMIFNVKTSALSNNVIEVRQSFDKRPQILFLEEGNDRIGLRVLFKLYSSDNIYHGHGMTETWFYPNGEMFITAAAMFENPSAHKGVMNARLDIDIPKELRIKSSRSDVTINDASMKSRHLFLTRNDPNAGVHNRLALYWRTGRMELDTYIFRNYFGLKGSPTYFRWPDYVRQAYGADPVQPSTIGTYADKIIPIDNGVRINWPTNLMHLNPTSFYKTFFRLAMVTDTNAVKSFVSAEREPVKMIISGGVIQGYIPEHDKASNKRGYNDQEGCYEVRKTGTEPLVITLPVDPLSRTIRVKAIALSGHGAVNMTLDGKKLLPQLTTDGGIADDPLAPIHEVPESPANASMVTVKLTDKPQKLIVEEMEGIQLVYQARDPRRNFRVYSTKTGSRWSGLAFSLLDGHARNMRAYNHQNWALTENLLHWFAWMGYTPEQMLDQLRDFVIIKNGPDEIIFKYTSNNANDGAQSEYLVSARADAPAMQINVSATFTVLKQWPYKSVQYFDAFPHRGVEPKDWWYKNVLHMSSEGKWQTYETVNQVTNGDLDIEKMIGTSFIGLYSSDRGNMLMLVKNLRPEMTTMRAICSNYIDLHMNVLLENHNMLSAKINRGYQVKVNYELAIWGDETLTQDQLIEIGKKSIKASKLIIPPN